MKKIPHPFPCLISKDVAPRTITLLLGILALTALGEAAATIVRWVLG